MNHAYAVIMAGGGGTRLWPLSRQDKPKPLLDLVNADRSMLAISVERLLPVIPAERILIVAGQRLMPEIRAQLPMLPPENLIVEPFGRDTAPAVGLGAVHVQSRDPDAVMAVLTADHFIADEETFRKAIAAACAYAAPGRVLTLGIQPTFASPGFGYIERGSLASKSGGLSVFHLSRFIEKPDQVRADTFFADRRYSWNSGMFIWPVRRVMEEFEKHAVALYGHLMTLSAAVGRADYDGVLSSTWPLVTPISVDFALMEHITQEIYVIPVEMGWADIGNFDALYQILRDGGAADGAANVIRSEGQVTLDVGGSLIRSKKLVAAIGVEDLVIIDTEDVLLICPRDRVQDVRQLVAQLKEQGKDRYL